MPVPPLNSLYFYLTKGCNLKCRHCWIAPYYTPEPKKDEVLSVDLFVRIIEQALPMGLHTIKLTGGEPFFHPEIFELLDIIAKRKLRLVIETNGTLCNQRTIDQIIRCVNPAISVSLDAADPETHELIRGVSGCFAPTVQAIELLAAANLKPQIIMAVMKENEDRIEAMVSFAARVKAGSVKFNFVAPISRGKSLEKQGHLLPLQRICEINTRILTELQNEAPLPLFTNIPIAFSPLHYLFEGKAGVGACSRCSIQNVLGVLSDGSYAMCGIGENVPEMIYGHASRDTLSDLWASAPVLKDVREKIPNHLEGVCSQCVMKKLCLGFCPAFSYYTKQSVSAPYWFCEAAHEQGLFPATRLF